MVIIIIKISVDFPVTNVVVFSAMTAINLRHIDFTVSFSGESTWKKLKETTVIECWKHFETN